MIHQGLKKHPVREVVLHSSATPAAWCVGKTAGQMRDEMRLWHMRDNGWRDIGYHFVIAPSGDFAKGRDVTQIGAHVMGRNAGTIGLCLVPVQNVARMAHFETFYTAAQRAAVRDLIRSFGGITTVTGHNAYANKLCPGFHVKTQEWL